MNQAALPVPQDAPHPGLFVVIEGGDGAGRSTQVRLVLPWLEQNGWAAVHLGLGRSALLQRAFRAYRRTLEAGPQTLALLYAADLRDQADGSVRSGLASGFVVVADRWTPAARARCQVRGADPGWLDAILPTDPQPDITFYLDTDPRQRLAREIAKRGLPEFRESGRDLGLDSDPLRGFVRYQSLLDRQYLRIEATGPQEWVHLNADLGPEAVQGEMRRALLTLMQGPGRGVEAGE